MPEEAKIKVKLDSQDATRTMLGMIGQMKAAAGSIGGGLAGFGMGIVRTFGQAATEPFRSELFGAAGALGGVLGRTALRATGIEDITQPINVAAQAQLRTVNALGMGASFMNDRQIQDVFRVQQQITGLEEQGRRNVQRATDPLIAEAGLGAVVGKLQELIDSVSIIGQGIQQMASGQLDVGNVLSELFSPGSTRP